MAETHAVNNPENLTEKAEEKIDEVAKELDIKIPKERSAFPIRVITLLTLVGGLSILGSTFTDFLVPLSANGAGLHFARIIAGICFIIIAYGLYKRKRWAIELYTLLVLVGLLVNWLYSLVPAAIVVYLWVERERFK